MSATDRQNRLLVAEDWKRVYQTFRNADFQSYDFDNLRRTMISYLRENYPEDFNDYIESSEYLALIDLIAFLGQNISFRIDLNARENFLELAERRESVLRLARLISYNPSRNQAANGFLKFTAVKTTEDLIDSNGINLKDQTIQWNDSTNSNWYEQFIKVINTALPTNGVFGKPTKRDVVASIPTEQYRVNGLNTTVPTYSFEKTIEGKSVPFQIVPADIVDGNLLEEAPLAGNNFAFVYRNDGRGPGSTTTGFFAHFRQGILDNGQFTVSQPIANQTVSIDTVNINDTDVWLYKLDSNGNEQDLWTKVDSVEGNNVIYNSINRNIRNVYSVLTRADDRINLMFSDGVFGELPKGNFRAYYRVSENRNMIITPAAMSGIRFSIPYLSKSGRQEEITYTVSLQSTVYNGSPSESSASIKTNAPATYYTQNRMITGEDYNVAPLAVSQEVVKVKSVNRTSSGISRYFDLIDTTGKYSNTNLYGNDGIVYKEYLQKTLSFSFTSQTDIEGTIINLIEPIFKNKKINHFYFDQFPTIDTSALEIIWEQKESRTNAYSGFLKDSLGELTVGRYSASNLRYVGAESLVKFVAPAGKFFNSRNELVSGEPKASGDRVVAWTKVVRIIGDGTNSPDLKNTGAIILSDNIPSGAILSQIRPKMAGSLVDDVKRQVIDQTFAYNNFGLRYNVSEQQWKLIKTSDLDAKGEFNAIFAGDKTGQGLDSSWLLKFETQGEQYTVTYRSLRYVFESDKEIRFYYDKSNRIYDSKTGQLVKDKISVLSINTQPNPAITGQPFINNLDWEILSEFRDSDGYVNSSKVELTFFDSDNDGVVDNPEVFLDIVDPDSVYIFDNNEKKLNSERIIIQKRDNNSVGSGDYSYVDPIENNITMLVKESDLDVRALSNNDHGRIFYFYETNIFKQYNSATQLLAPALGLVAHIGRDNLKFHYVHSADSDSRIDPSASNIIDTYLLTRGYDREYRLYLTDQLKDRPLPPSSDQLYRSFGSSINKIKSISDEVIYHPVKYKVLFGSKAVSDLQATFKAVKNPDVVLNDNDIKTRVISLINQYFAVDNWDFGETFYFQELATFVMTKMAPDLVTFIIVPGQVDQTFGSLFEIRAEPDEIFISNATVSDVVLIDEITATRLNADGRVITSTNTDSQGLQSSRSTGTLNSSGGLSF